MDDWNLAILHYHLNPGGVTRVILGHLASLASLPDSQQPSRVVVLFDGQAEHWPTEPAPSAARFDVELVAVPGLAYDHGRCRPLEELAPALTAGLLQHGLKPEDTVLHVHNHALGKNAALPGACRELAGQGYRQLLQFHDFAEDLRPVNYRHLAACLGGDGAVAREIYFHGPRVHYAVLNSRDAGVFQRAGLPANRLHRLPNPVTAPDVATDAGEARRRVRRLWPKIDDASLVLYPVRGIRRKNVGELLLWSTALRGRAFFAMTLPPRNPVEQPVYAQWTELGERHHLPIDLAAATRDQVQYHDLVSAADWEITTSVAEGFGMVFLESWLVGKPLLGRDLPEISADFREAGVSLPALQDAVSIPWEWLDRDQVAASLLRHFRELCESYGMPQLASSSTRRDLDELLSGPTLDFAYLDLALQVDLLDRLASSDQDWDAFWEANPVWLSMRDGKLAGHAVIEQNRKTIRSQYGLHASGRRLYDIYTKLFADAGPATVEPLDRPAEVLRSFLQLRRLHPIRLA